MLYMYQYNTMKKPIERVQTGIRIEKKLLKVLKGLAEHLDITVGDLVEGMALHCFESKPPFSNETCQKIEQLKSVYDLKIGAGDSHKLTETNS